MNPEEPKDAAEDLGDECWLDDALARYSSAAPRPGLERRILAGIEAHATQLQRRWVYAFAGAAAVVVFAIVIANVVSSRPNASTNQTSRTLPSLTSSSNGEKKVGARMPKTSGHGRLATAQQNVTSGRTVLAAADVKQEQSPVDKPLFVRKQSSSQTGFNQSSSQTRESIIAQEHPAPEIYVSDLKTIQPLEVRELAPVKEIN